MKLVIPPPILTLISAAVMWGLAKTAPSLSFVFPGQTLIAGLFPAVGLTVMIVAVGAFFRADTTVNPHHPDKASKLVISGLYRVTRNPMYLGMALVLIGWVLWLGNLLAVLALIGFVWFITVFQIKPEEAVLKQKFGDEFEAYMGRVRRWI